MQEAGDDITGIVKRISQAEDSQVCTDAYATLYEEIRRLAKPALMGELPHNRLKTTDVIHQAFERLFLRPKANGHTPHWPDRLSFYGAAAKSIRDVLVDEARRRLALKRGGGRRSVPLESVGDPFCMPPVMLIELRGELEKLGEINGRAARIVELRFFAGLSAEDVAELMRVSPSTVRREWDMARLWLYERLDDADARVDGGGGPNHQSGHGARS